MKPVNPKFTQPDDHAVRKSLEPVVCYPTDALPKAPLAEYEKVRADADRTAAHLVAPRDASCFEVPQGHFFRITSVDGPQVGDLNLWNKTNLDERFYAGKTRALHGTHLGVGDSLWSSFPAMRQMATITEDTLDWYGFDEFGLSVHDVIGTRCDPYTHNLLSNGGQYHYCCHSNLTRALAAETGMPLLEAESYVHDVLNVFMCTGFCRHTGAYLMKGTPARPGDYLEFYAHMDLLGGLSACPGGDCATMHSSDQAECSPLLVEVFKPKQPLPEAVTKPLGSNYNRQHIADSDKN